MRDVDVDMRWNKGMVERMLELNEPQRCGGCSTGLEEGGVGIGFEDTEEQSTAKRPTPTCISSLSPWLSTSTHNRRISGAPHLPGLARTCDSLFAFWIPHFVYLLSFLSPGKRNVEALRVGCGRGSWPEVEKNWIRRYEYEFMRDATSCDSSNIT
jgi:hypothetical protein